MYVHDILSRYKWMKKEYESDIKKQKVLLEALAKLTAQYIVGGKKS